MLKDQGGVTLIPNQQAQVCEITVPAGTWDLSAVGHAEIESEGGPRTVSISIRRGGVTKDVDSSTASVTEVNVDYTEDGVVLASSEFFQVYASIDGFAELKFATGFVQAIEA